MYCNQCGKELTTEDKFCPDCGTAQAQSEQAPFVQTQATEVQPVQVQPADTPVTNAPPPSYALHPPPVDAPDSPPETPRKSKKGIFIAVLSVVVIIAAAIAVYFLFFRSTANLLTVGRAFVNLGAEVEERFENTPFKALAMLPEIFEDGSLTADIEYSSDILGGLLSADMFGKVKLSSNTNAREFSLEAEVDIYGEEIDLEVFMNRERLALRAGFLDDRFYGITYDTFREDVRVFGRLLFLDDETMDMLADIVDQINEMMNAEDISDDEDALDIYSDVFMDFIKNVDISSRRTHIESGGERARCTRVDVRISKEALFTFLNELVDTLENDERARAQFDTYNYSTETQGFYMYTNLDSFEQLIREARRAVWELERIYEGDLILKFFIGRENRLLRFEINEGSPSDASHEVPITILDFGRSIEDIWVLEFYDNGNSSMLISWDYNVLSENHINTIHAAGDGIDSITLISDWDKGQSSFELGYISQWGTGELTGIFIEDGINFMLLLDNVMPGAANGSLKIELVAVQGSQIDDISFINIDRWGRELLGVVMRFILGGIFS